LSRYFLDFDIIEIILRGWLHPAPTSFYINNLFKSIFLFTFVLFKLL